MFFLWFFLSPFLHEEAALFYICFDVVIVVNTKYILKLKHTTRDNKARYLVSLSESIIWSERITLLSLHNAFFLVVKCIECIPLSYWGIGFGPGWGLCSGVDGRCCENYALDNEIAFYQELNGKWTQWIKYDGAWLMGLWKHADSHQSIEHCFLYNHSEDEKVGRMRWKFEMKCHTKQPEFPPASSNGN